jgi:ATP-dependent Clp protease ATP-binding subunit ClpA
MFERYTEKARRIIFFARYEASQFGSPYIETEHLLLGLLREDKALTNRFLRSHASVESIRKQIEGHTTIREKVSTSVDLPLSNECKRVLAYAAEEAERLSHKHIGTEHLLWLCTTICKSVHSTRLSGKRRIRSWWLPSAAPSGAGNRDRGSRDHDAGGP